MPDTLKLTPLSSTIIDISGSLSLLLMMGLHSFECFVYFRLDSNLKEIVTGMLVRCKVRSN